MKRVQNSGPRGWGQSEPVTWASFVFRSDSHRQTQSVFRLGFSEGEMEPQGEEQLARVLTAAMSCAGRRVLISRLPTINGEKQQS